MITATEAASRHCSWVRLGPAVLMSEIIDWAVEIRNSSFIFIFLDRWVLGYPGDGNKVLYI